MMAESVSLNKRKQSRFTKKVEKVKDKVKKGVFQIKDNVRKPTPKVTRGLVYVGHIPHGFYEIEMENYFSQFGKVTNVRVCRSKRTGNSKGFGFVEFENTGVAEIAAETMDNYLMFNRRLIAKFIPPDKSKKHIFKGWSWSEHAYPLKFARKQHRENKNKNKMEGEYLLTAKKQLKAIKTKLKKLDELGLKHTVEPVDVPDDKVNLISNSHVTEWEETYVTDPYDSDIEVKVKKPRKLENLRLKVAPKNISKRKDKLGAIGKLKELKKVPKDKLFGLITKESFNDAIAKSVKKLKMKRSF